MSVNKLSVRSLVKKPPLELARADPKWALPDAFIGVEIETENCRVLDQRGLTDAGWTWKEDGSLRNSGMEFVFGAPLCGRAITRAIDAFFDKTKPPVSYLTNPRAAVHIHINWLDDQAGADIGALRKLLTIMYCIEPAVFEWVEAARKWCGYASQMNELPDKKLRTLMTSESPDTLAATLNEGSGTRNRYYGMNLAALARFGTVEFRYFPCTTDKGTMEEWINFVMLVKRAAVEYPEDHIALIEKLSTVEGIRDFVMKYFDHSAINGRLLECLDIDAAVNRMIDFRFLVNLTPARNQAKGSWVTSAAAARFLGKRFPEAAAKRRQTDDLVSAYRRQIASGSDINYEEILQLFSQQQRGNV